MAYHVFLIPLGTFSILLSYNQAEQRNIYIFKGVKMWWCFNQIVLAQKKNVCLSIPALNRKRKIERTTMSLGGGDGGGGVTDITNPSLYAMNF